MNATAKQKEKRCSPGTNYIRSRGLTSGGGRLTGSQLPAQEPKMKMMPPRQNNKRRHHDFNISKQLKTTKNNYAKNECDRKTKLTKLIIRLYGAKQFDPQQPKTLQYAYILPRGRITFVAGV